jgi:RecA/RadA recombinase
MIVKQQSKEAALEIARQKFPDAENDIVRLDLYAQEVRKELLDMMERDHAVTDEQRPTADLYAYLVKLRKEMLDEVIEKESGFEVVGKLQD